MTEKIPCLATSHPSPHIQILTHSQTSEIISPSLKKQFTVQQISYQNSHRTEAVRFLITKRNKRQT